MRSTRALSGAMAGVAVPLVLAGCMAVRPDAGAPNPGGRSGPAPGAGAGTPSQVGTQPAGKGVASVERGGTSLPTESELITGGTPESALPTPRTSAPTDRRPAPVEHGDSLAGHPDPRPGQAAGTAHQPHPQHQRPHEADRPAAGSPGWPGSGPNPCALASAIGIFSPGSTADHACENFRAHARHDRR